MTKRYQRGQNPLRDCFVDPYEESCGHRTGKDSRKARLTRIANTEDFRSLLYFPDSSKDDLSTAAGFLKL